LFLCNANCIYKVDPKYARIFHPENEKMLNSMDYKMIFPEDGRIKIDWTNLFVLLV
jgi:hypothetical protein